MELMAWFVEGMQECFSERLGQYTTAWFKVATFPGSRFFEERRYRDSERSIELLRAAMGNESFIPLGPGARTALHG